MPQLRLFRAVPRSYWDDIWRMAVEQVETVELEISRPRSPRSCGCWYSNINHGNHPYFPSLGILGGSYWDRLAVIWTIGSVRPEACRRRHMKAPLEKHPLKITRVRFSGILAERRDIPMASPWASAAHLADRGSGGHDPQGMDGFHGKSIYKSMIWAPEILENLHVSWCFCLWLQNRTCVLLLFWGLLFVLGLGWGGGGGVGY